MSDQAGPAPQPTPPVTLFGGEVAWRPVSPALATARTLVLVAALAVPLVVSVVLALVLGPALWVLPGAVVASGAWGAWLVRRQVSAISWAELDEEIVIRKGRIVRSLVSVPYGRLQYVDLQSGPLTRALGIASCTLHTASPESGGSLPGLQKINVTSLGEVGAPQVDQPRARERRASFSFQYEHIVDAPVSSGGIIRRIPVTSRLAAFLRDPATGALVETVESETET